MNTGTVSTRYAKALFRYVEETGGGERVAAQAYRIVYSPDIASIKLEPELERFVSLVIENGRLEEVKMMLRGFVTMYYKSRGYEIAHLTTVEASPELEARLKALLEKQFDCKVLLDTKVDPALIGGFVVEIADQMLDASVRGQIETLRRKFVISNNRIV